MEYSAVLFLRQLSQQRHPFVDVTRTNCIYTQKKLQRPIALSIRITSTRTAELGRTNSLEQGTSSDKTMSARIIIGIDKLLGNITAEWTPTMIATHMVLQIIRPSSTSFDRAAAKITPYVKWRKSNIFFIVTINTMAIYNREELDV